MAVGLINLAFGLLAVIVGLAVSVGSFMAVSRAGGHYMVAWGAVVFGAWRAIVGLTQVLRAAAMPDGRAAIGRLLWPRGDAARAVRLVLVAAVAAIAWFAAPDAWTTISPVSLSTFKGTGDIKSLAYLPGGKWIAVGMGGTANWCSSMPPPGRKA